MKKFVGIVLLFGLFIAAVPTVSLAAPQWVTGEKLALDKVAADDVYVVGESATIDNDVRGDLVVVGGDVIVNGAVSGDVWAVGGNLTMNGRVGDDLRVLGGDVLVAGQVVDDLLGAGGAVTVADTARIGGDLRLGVGEFTLYGTTSGDVALWAGKARINGQIAGNADLHVSEGLSFGKDGRVAQKLTYWAAAEDTTLAQYAKAIEFKQALDPSAAKKGLATLFTLAGVGVVLWKWLSILLLGAVLIWIVPKYFPHLSDTSQARALGGKYIGSGLVLFLVSPALIMVLMMTVVGMPLAVVMLMAYCLLLVLGAISGAYAVGSYIRGHRHASEWQQLGSLALGVLVLLVLGYIPVLGLLFRWIVIIYGLGSVWHDKMRLLTAYRKSADR